MHNKNKLKHKRIESLIIDVIRTNQVFNRLFMRMLNIIVIVAE